MITLRAKGIFLAIAIQWLTGAATSMADMTQLAGRLPHNGNALLVLDIAKLLDTPLAKTDSWQSKLMSGYADRPLAVPATARQVAMTGFIHPAELEAIWQAAVVDLPNPPRLEPIVQRQGGYLDELSGKKSAWSARDTYFIQLDDHTMGVIRPGDRGAAARWVAGSASSAPMSSYLQSALASSGSAQILFALDLTNAVGLGAVNFAYGMGALPSLEKTDAGRDKLMAALGSVKGLKLSMTVGKEINSQITIDFDQDVSALGDSAKALVTDVLKATGVYDPQVETWEFKASGKTIVGTGVSKPEAIGRLIALLAPGDLEGHEPPKRTPSQPGNPPESAPQPTPPGDAPLEASPAAASQAYYRAVSKILDSMSAKTSPTESGAWLHTQSRVIQQLPAVGVDPMLMEWGDSIAGAFNRAAQTLAIGQQQAQVAAQGVATPVGQVTSYEGGYGTTDTAESRAAFQNAQQQRRQAAQQQRAAAADQAMSILNDAMATRGKIRTLMVQKYNVEF